MLQVYVIKASDMPKMDINGKADPYVNIYGCDYKDRFKCGQTEIIKKNLNPVFDSSCQKPFNVPFISARSIKFELFDYDAVGAHDKIGTAKFDFFTNKLNVEETLLVKPSRNTKHTPKITVKVVPPSTLYPPSRFDISFTHLYFFLTFNPPQGQRLINLQLFNFSRIESSPFQHIAFGNKASGFKMDSIPSHAGPAGYTHCIRVNLLKRTNDFFVPFANFVNFNGQITIHVAASTRADKTKNAKGKKSFDASKMRFVTLFEHSFPVSCPQPGVVETILPGFCVEYRLNNISAYPIPQFNRRSEPSLMTIARKYAKTLIPETKVDGRFAITTGRPISFASMCYYHDIPPPTELAVCLGWDTETDLDGSIMAYTEDYNCDTIVFYGNKTAYDGAIHHGGDNLTGQGKGDDERIIINFEKLPKKIKILAVAITSFREVNFAYVKGGFLRLCDSKNNRELLFLPLRKKKNNTCLIFAFFVNLGDKWFLFPVLKYVDENLPRSASNHITKLLHEKHFIPKMITRILE